MPHHQIPSLGQCELHNAVQKQVAVTLLHGARSWLMMTARIITTWSQLCLVVRKKFNNFGPRGFKWMTKTIPSVMKLPPPPKPDRNTYSYEKPMFCPWWVECQTTRTTGWTIGGNTQQSWSLNCFRCWCWNNSSMTSSSLARNALFTENIANLEFYEWLGCHFHMASFQRILDHDLWQS